jgi:hypothetical protein
MVGARPSPASTGASGTGPDAVNELSAAVAGRGARADKVKVFKFLLIKTHLASHASLAARGNMRDLRN